MKSILLLTKWFSKSILAQLMAGTLFSFFFAWSPHSLFTEFSAIAVLGLFLVAGAELKFHRFLLWRNEILAVFAVGSVLAFGGVFLVCQAFGYSLNDSLIIAAVLLSSGTGVTVQALLQSNQLKSDSGQFLVALSVLEDLPPALMLPFFWNHVPGESAQNQVLKAILALCLVLSFLLALKTLDRKKVNLRPQWIFAAIFILIAHFLGQIFSNHGLSPLFAAMLVGASSRTVSEVNSEKIFALIQKALKWVLPIYFFLIGMQMVPQTVGNLRAWFLILCLLVVACLAKSLPTFLILKKLKRRDASVDAHVVSWGLVPRGVPGLAFSALAFGHGAISGEVFTLLVTVVSLSTWAGLIGLNRNLDRQMSAKKLLETFEEMRND